MRGGKRRNHPAQSLPKDREAESNPGGLRAYPPPPAENSLNDNPLAEFVPEKVTDDQDRRLALGHAAELEWLDWIDPATLPDRSEPGDLARRGHRMNVSGKRDATGFNA